MVSRSQRERELRAELKLETLRHEHRMIEGIAHDLATNEDMPYLIMILGGGLTEMIAQTIKSASRREDGQFPLAYTTGDAAPAGTTAPARQPGDYANLGMLMMGGPLGLVASQVPGTPLWGARLATENVFNGGRASGGTTPWAIVGDSIEAFSAGLITFGSLILILKYLNLGGVVKSVGASGAGTAIMGV